MSVTMRPYAGEADYAPLRHLFDVVAGASPLHYGTADLNAAKHPFQLPLRDYTVLNLDLVQQGVGGDDSWGAWPHKPFLIPCQEYHYEFRLRPLASGENPEKLARK